MKSDLRIQESREAASWLLSRTTSVQQSRACLSARLVYKACWMLSPSTRPSLLLFFPPLLPLLVSLPTISLVPWSAPLSHSLGGKKEEVWCKLCTVKSFWFQWEKGKQENTQSFLIIFNFFHLKSPLIIKALLTVCLMKNNNNNNKLRLPHMCGTVWPCAEPRQLISRRHFVSNGKQKLGQRKCSSRFRTEHKSLCARQCPTEKDESCTWGSKAGFRGRELVSQAMELLRSGTVDNEANQRPPTAGPSCGDKGKMKISEPGGWGHQAGATASTDTCLAGSGDQ